MNDQCIRNALKLKLLVEHKLQRETVIIDELGINHGGSRVDLAVVNGVIHGFELKSDRDTLVRLPEQVQAFSRIFDLVTLVVGERHLRRAVDLVPDWWGIRVARMKSARLSFHDLKLPMTNPSPDPAAIVTLLWRTEALGFLEELGVAQGLRSKSRADIYQKLIEMTDACDLSRRVRHCLKVRGDWRSRGTLLSDGGLFQPESSLQGSRDCQGRSSSRR